MKGFIQIAAVLILSIVLTACATDGTKASYEGYNMANQGNPASQNAATMVAPITSHF